MEITSSSPSTSSSSAASTAKPRAINSDFETFLKMLTVQMQNQDPLNPADASEFAVQLASFSTVEQQVRTNELLTSLGDRLAGQNMGQLAGWVGMTARAEMPVAFAGEPVRLDLSTATGTDLARLVVRDMRGAIVHQQDTDASGGSIDWTGRDETGRPLPHGLYQIEVDSFQGDRLLGTRPVESQDRIIEARIGKNGEGTVLVLAGGHEIKAGDVLGLRQASRE